jgi:1-deoxy-D-xylulose-5-phosphate synthase
MAEGTGLKEMRQRFPERFFDVGIAGQHAVTFAGGLAADKITPVVAMYSTFLQRAYDQVLHDICVQNLHVVFALDRAGIVGEDGQTQHGVFDIAYLRTIPNMKLMAPKDEEELPHMLYTAIYLYGWPGGTSLSTRKRGWGVLERGAAHIRSRQSRITQPVYHRRG